MAKICKLLLVEDHVDVQNLLRELFASEGYRFIIVSDGGEMRRALDSEPEIDAVIIDILLPGGLDGLTLADEVAGRGLPAILVTGDHTRLDKLEASGHRHILKPFALASFVALVEEVLRETKVQCERDVDGASIHAFARKERRRLAGDEARAVVAIELPLEGGKRPLI